MKRLVALISVLVCVPLFAAINAKAVWEVRQGSADTNGGAFVVGSSAARGGIAVPSQPSATCINQSGGFANQTNVWVVITFTDAVGETAISPVSAAVTNCTNGGTSNKLTITAPASAPGCHAGTTCTWNAYICGSTADSACTSTGPWALVASGSGLTLGADKTVTAIPALSGTQPSGTDYSLQTGAQISVTNAVTNSTTTITSATAAFSGLHAHNVCYLTGGTGPAATQWREIIRVSNATTIIVDNAIANSGTGATLKCGGALLSPSIAYGQAVSSNWIFVKAGTPASCGTGTADYCVTTTTASTANGTLSSAISNLWIIGYSSSRTAFNTDTRPIIQAGSSIATFALITNTNGTNGGFIYNLVLDLSSYTASTGITNTGSGATVAAVQRVKVANSTANGVNLLGTAIQVEATGFSGTSGITATYCFFCEAHDGTTLGISASTLCVDCIADTNTGSTTDGIRSATCIGCVAYANGRAGFDAITTVPVRCVNCIAEANVGQAWRSTAASASNTLINSAGYNNCTGGGCSGNDFNYAHWQAPIGFIAVTAGSVFTNAAGGDFSLNNTASRGALLRAAGYPAAFPTGTTANYRDIGAAQHPDPAGAVTRSYSVVK